MFKRAHLSVVRRKAKSVIFFLFLFIVANLVLTSISIKNATEESMRIARISLGSEVILQSDVQKIREQFDLSNQKPNEDNFSKRKDDMKDMHEMMNQSNVAITDVNSLKEIKYVSDVKYTFTVSAEEKSFSLYEEETDEQKQDSQFGRGGKKFNQGLQIKAINTFKLEDNYVNKTIELVQGEPFEEEDNDTVIISYELATSNELNIDDEIIVTDLSGDEHKLKIIGIYQNSSMEGFNNNYNLIYINANTGTKFLTEEEYNDGNYNISSAVFYLDDPENADAFKQEASKIITDLDSRNLTLDIDNNSYEQMISSIKGVASFSNTILIIVVIASIVVISLIVINSLKDRNYEIGVLLSLGEKKSKIIGQFIVELLLIATISFILSIGTSLLTSQKLADILIENQNNTVEIINDTPMGERGNGFRSGNIQEKRKGTIGSLTGFGVSNTIDEIDVSVTLKDITLLFIIGYGIIFVSMVVPSIKILHSDPKDILSRRE